MSRKWTYEIGYGYESILRNGVMVNKEQAVRALNDYEARIATLEKALNIDTDLTIAELRVDLRDATARIAELEAEIERLTVHSDIERQDDKSPNDTQTQTIVYGKWIPVSERLPEDGEVVWLWDGNNLGMGYYLVLAGQFMDRDTPLRRIKPTHWMPLPESPNDTQTQTVVYGKEREE